MQWTSPRSTLWVLKAILKYSQCLAFFMSAVPYSEISLLKISQIFLFAGGMLVTSPVPNVSSCFVKRSYISFITYV